MMQVVRNLVQIAIKFRPSGKFSISEWKNPPG